LAACGGGDSTSSAAPSTSSAVASSGSSSISKTTVTSSTALAILGQPPQSISVGSAYYFNANTTGGITSAVTFSIQNKPYWATLNTSTGELRGTPDKAGTYSNIQISASDGRGSATLPAFAIVVNGTDATTTASATI